MSAVGEKSITNKYGVMRIRYFLLLLFILLSMTNSFHWIIYAIVELQIKHYYNTTTFWINSTSTVYMIVYVIGIVPATYYLDHYGLRKSLVLGSILNAIGMITKCFSLDRSKFTITMIGQTILSVSQLFILNIPPVLSANWFAADELTIATAYGVFGNQLGIGIGFLLVPLVMPETNTNNNNNNNSNQYEDQIKHGLIYFTYPMAIIATIIAILIYLFFEDKPEIPPSKAQELLRINHDNKQSYMESVKELFLNNNFRLLFISYGLNVGVCYAISTVLGAMVVNTMGSNYKNDAGFMGSLIIISGIFGSIICGYVLAYSSGKFKMVTALTYLFAMIACIMFAMALKFQSITIMYIVCFKLGFFMAGYLPIGFEFAAEVTYPQSEGISAGLLNTSAQIFGIILTYLSGLLLDHIDPFLINIGYAIILAVGLLLTVLVTNDLRRQDAQRIMKSSKSKSNKSKL